MAVFSSCTLLTFLKLAPSNKMTLTSEVLPYAYFALVPIGFLTNYTKQSVVSQDICFEGSSCVKSFKYTSIQMSGRPLEIAKWVKQLL